MGQFGTLILKYNRSSNTRSKSLETWPKDEDVVDKEKKLMQNHTHTHAHTFLDPVL